ncbi:MAG TPA: Uma2 family endonuclease [Thermoleophilaceae bacterium]|jgi:Uma2 family endonuclease
MSSATARMTVDEYYAITVEGDRKQLVDGAIVVNEPRLFHAVLQSRLHSALSAWIAEGDGRGIVTFPTDVRIDDHNLYGPDLIWLAEEHRQPVREDRLRRIPDLCVEIRSAGTWRHDLGAKTRGYERAGLPELWLVDDRDDRVLVRRRSPPGAPRFDVTLELGVGDTLASPQLPGFALPLARLFAD